MLRHISMPQSLIPHFLCLLYSLHFTCSALSLSYISPLPLPSHRQFRFPSFSSSSDAFFISDTSPCLAFSLSYTSSSSSSLHQQYLPSSIFYLVLTLLNNSFMSSSYTSSKTIASSSTTSQTTSSVIPYLALPPISPAVPLHYPLPSLPFIHPSQFQPFFISYNAFSPSSNTSPSTFFPYPS